MDDLSKQEVGFIEDGMVDIGGGARMFTAKHSVGGVPTKVEVFSSSLVPPVWGGDKLRVRIAFTGVDDNERHGLRLSLSPELATVIANAMLVSVASMGSSEVLSHTVIQSSEDYTAEEAERRRWELEDDD
jgi:hypothetical protein